MQISKRRGEQLSRMIDELIDLSRLDARSMVLRRVPTDVAALLRELGAEFQEEFRRRGLRFSLRLPPELPRLRCDPDKLRQVFTNLIGNALKFSPDGGEIELGRRKPRRRVPPHVPRHRDRHPGAPSTRGSSRSSTRSTPRPPGASAAPASA